MLKSKKSLYILFPVVIFIWGIVIYRIVDALSDKTESAITFSNSGKSKIDKIERDTFSLRPIEKDPFLGIIYNKQKPVFTHKDVNPLPSIEWPSINYLGLVSGTGGKQKIHIFQISGQQYLMEIGEKVGEIKLVSASASSVKLSYKGQRKEFSK